MVSDKDKFQEGFTDTRVTDPIYKRMSIGSEARYIITPHIAVRAAAS
jgi:hypothetical protein